MSNFSCNVRGDLFARAMAIASTDPTRHYIGGVYIAPCKAGGALLVATDGGAMVVLHDPQGEVNGAAIVKLPAALLKAASAAKGSPTVHIHKGEATVSGLRAGDVEVGGTYPDWRRVLPKEAGVATEAAFDAGLLQRLARALTLTGNKTAPISLRGADASSPHWAYGSDPAAVGVIMPYRNAPGAVARSWLNVD